MLPRVHCFLLNGKLRSKQNFPFVFGVTLEKINQLLNFGVYVLIDGIKRIYKIICYRLMILVVEGIYLTLMTDILSVVILLAGIGEGKVIQLYNQGKTA